MTADSKGHAEAAAAPPVLLLRYQWCPDGSEVQQRYPLTVKLRKASCSKLLSAFLKQWCAAHPDLALTADDVELARTPVGPGGAVGPGSAVAEEVGTDRADCQLFVRRRGGLPSQLGDDARVHSDGAVGGTEGGDGGAAPAVTDASSKSKRGGLDYSRFDRLEDSDDEALVPSGQVSLPHGMPREAVNRADYEKVFQLLLSNKDLPYTPIPDVEQMWGYYKHGGTDEQALLDQACEAVGKLQMRLPEGEWKTKTFALLRKLDQDSREDEARMWSVIHMTRFPKDQEAYYNQGVLLNKQCDKAKFGGAPSTQMPGWNGSSQKIPTERYCALFNKAAQAHYRRCLKVDPKNKPGYINLIGCIERNEPSGWYDEVHALASQAARNGIWYNIWQRPPHFVPTLPGRPWHDPEDFALCRALHSGFEVIRGEYDTYIERLANRKDWDDSDTTPGPSDVGGRPGALHDGGLTKSGRWKEVPLFANSSLREEYASFFPETIRILQTHCADAVGLALCGGGDVIFSVLTPGTQLRPHCGPTNARLTCHLGIRVPRTAAQGLSLRVANEAPRGWEEGRCLVFDDSFEHEVIFADPGANEPYAGERVVLLANFWHPAFKFKNDVQWRERSEEGMADVGLETLPQTALANVSPPGP